MALLTTLKFITSHPLTRKSKALALLRFLVWQIRCRTSTKPIPYPFVDNTFLLAEKGMTGATGNIYSGLHEFSEMGFLLHFLREEDLFIDAGANIGSYTVLAAGVRKANAVAVEPSKATFNKLKRNISFNHLDDKVKVLNIGLGSEKGSVRLTKSLDTVNHIVNDDKFSEESTEAISIEKIDDLFPLLDKPTLIKIDVEGFETEVVKGAINALNNHYLKAIIIELNGSGWRYGYDENEIHRKLVKCGFTPCEYNPFYRKLEKKEGYGSNNTVYIRDFTFVEQRLKSSDKIKVFDQCF